MRGRCSALCVYENHRLVDALFECSTWHEYQQEMVPHTHTEVARGTSYVTVAGWSRFAGIGARAAAALAMLENRLLQL